MEEIVGFVIAIILGALIGFQREHKKQEYEAKGVAGIRTFILISLFGATLGHLSGNFVSTWVIVGFVAVMFLSVVSYYLTYRKLHNLSETTQIVFIFMYVLGVMCTTGHGEFAVLLGILIMAFLTFKERLHLAVKNFSKEEIFAIVKFALLSFVILPILPNYDYSPADIPGVVEIFSTMGIDSTILVQLNVFNPYYIWLMIIFIAGINFVGYFLTKLLGSRKGYGLLGFLGGLVSSTAVTLSMSAKSKTSKNIWSPFAIAVMVAMSVMFFRIIFEVAVINSSLLSTLILPLGVMAVLSGIIIFIFYRRKKGKSKAPEIELKQPFAFLPALKFGLFFTFILFVAKLTQLLFGNLGIYITSILSGLADVDAITLSMASLSKSGGVSEFVATTAILLAAISNTLVKALMAFFLGGKKFGRWILMASVIVLLAGAITLFWI